MNDNDVDYFAYELLMKHGRSILYKNIRLHKRKIIKLVTVEFINELNSKGFEMAEKIQKKIDEIIAINQPFRWRIYFPNSDRYAELIEILEYSSKTDFYEASDCDEALFACKEYEKENKKIGISTNMEIHPYNRDGELVEYFILQQKDIWNCQYGQ